MKKVQRKNKSFFFLATLLMTCCALIFSVLSACNKDNEVKSDPQGDEAGTWYYDYEGDQNREYQLTLADGLKFTFAPYGETSHIGTYVIKNNAITLTDGEWTQTATYDDESDNIVMTYGGSEIEFLRKTPYTVTFDTAGGSAVAERTVINGRTLSKPEDPVRDDYLFAGWFTDNTYTTPYSFGALPVTGNTTLYARWFSDPADGAEFIVTYDLGYEGAEQLPATETTGGKLYEVAQPAERAGYTFEGWWISMENDGERLTTSFELPAANGSGGTVFNADTTLFALWHKNDSQLKAAPAVNVNSSAISWDAVEGATSTKVVITAPDGTSNTQNSTANTIAATFNQTGVYRIELTAETAGGVAVSETAVRYYTNNALARVSGVRVMEPNTLVYSPVDGAERYTVTVECGNPLHNHTALDNGTSRYFNFANCDMKKGGIKFVIKAYAEGYAPSSTTFIFDRSLDKVANLDIEDDIVVWDDVEGAAYYTVKVGEETYNITDNSFSLKNMGAKEYSVSVTPVASGYNSPEANTISYKKTTPAVPADIRLSGTTLSWTAESGASYKVVYNNKETAVPANESSIDLSTVSGITWTGAGEYTVQLKVEKDGASALSEGFTFVNNVTEPTLSYKNGTVSWKPVAGAVSYTVTLNGTNVATITNGSTSYKFEDGLAKEGVNKIGVIFTDAQNAPSDPATIEVNALAVTFNSGRNDSVTLYKATGDELGAPVASSVTGYKFAAWYNTPAGPASNGAVYSSPFFTGSSELVLYAYYEPREYTVQYAGDDIGELTTTTVTYEKDFTFDVPENDIGTRVFGGWFSSPYGQGRQLTDTYGNSLAPWNDATDNVKVYPFWVDEALSFALESGNYTVSAGARINATDSVTIPTSYNGMPVTKIAAAAFSDCGTLKIINIPDTITDIPEGAFDGCTSLEQVNIYSAGASVPRYSSDDGVLFDSGSSAASHAPRPMYMPAAKTGSYTIPDGVDVIPSSAFAGSSITRIVIPASVTVIESEAFANCFNLASVTFNDPEAAGTLKIGKNAFMNNFALTSITFPKRLTDIALSRIDTLNLDTFTSLDDLTSTAEDVFLINYERGNVSASDYDPSLEAVNVTPGGTYSSADGILYKGNELVYCPELKDIPSDFKFAGNVRSIATGAFINTSLPETIEFPASITTIGNFAFAGTDIYEVVFKGDIAAQAVTVGDYAFYNCSSLESVEFEENSNISTLGTGAFMDDDYLSTITIPATVSSIGDRAFALTEYSDDLEITFETADSADELTLGNSVFYGREIYTLDLPASIRISGNTFNGIEVDNIEVNDNPTIASVNGGFYLRNSEGKIDTLIIFFADDMSEFTFAGDEKNDTSTVTTIAGGAFANAGYSLEKVVIPASITTIGEGAFRGNTNITTIEFADGGNAPLTIGEYAFAELYDDYWEEGGFSSIILPDRPVTIGDYAFMSAGKVETIDLGGTVTVGNYAFSMTGYANDEKGTALVITPSVETIGEYAFEGESSWYGDSTGIKSVTFEGTSKLKTIGANAFNGSHITEITIPASVETIGAAAFYDTALTSIVFEDGTAPLTIGETGAAIDESDSIYQSASYYAVFGGTSIASISLPGRLSTIGDFAFASLEADTPIAITFGENSNLRLIGLAAFYGSNIASITIPGSVTTVNDYAFGSTGTYAESQPLDITFAAGESDLELGNRVFAGSYLTTLTLPARLTSIGANAFSYSTYNCSNLASINVNSECKAYASKDGMLYTGGFKELLLCPSANAGTDGTVTVDEKTEKISSLAFYSCANITTINFAGNNLKEIGDRAFARCGGLTAIAIPDSVTTLGNDIFESCNALESLRLPANLESFSSTMLGCENLESIEIVNGVNFTTDKDKVAIFTNDMSELLYYLPTATKTSYTVPEGVKVIGENTFNNNSYLTSITLPSTLTHIGDLAFYSSQIETVQFTAGKDALAIGSQAFANTDSLTSISLPANVSSIGDHAFSRSGLAEITLGGSNSMLDTIGASAFEGTSLTTIVLPDSVRLIDDRAFASSALAYITLNEGLIELGDGVFYDDESLESVSLPSTLKTMGESMFVNCSLLSNITFADNIQITRLPRDTFSGCDSLTTIRIPAGVTEIEGRDPDAASGAQGNVGAFENLANLTSVTFEDGSKCLEIGTGAFEYSGVQSVTLPNSVTTIASSAFAHTPITEITIPRTVTSIGQNAFSMCDRLTSVRIEGSITSLPSLAFQGCTSLTTLVLPATLATIDASTFTNCNNIRTIEILDGDAQLVVDEESGALYNVSKTELLMLPAGTTEYVVPATVTASTLTSVLNKCSTLTKISVESGNSVYGSDENSTTVFNKKSGDIAYIANGTKSISLPDYITTLTEATLTALNNCTTLESIELANAGIQRDFTVKNNVAYNVTSGTDGEVWTIAFVPAMLDTYTIPNEVTNILGSAQNGYSFADFANNITVIDYEEGRTQPLTIGGAYMWYTSAFGGMEALTEVKLPAGTVIGNQAFEDCVNLNTVTIAAGSGDEEATIGDSAFAGTALSALVIPEGYISLGSAVFEGTSMSSLTIPLSLVNFEDDSFSGTSIAAIELDENHKALSFSDYVLSSKDGSVIYMIQSGLESYTIGKDVEDASAIIDALKNVATLKEVKVEEGNTSYVAYYGVLYENKETVTSDGILLLPAAMTTFVIPEQMTEIYGGGWSDRVFYESNIDTLTYNKQGAYTNSFTIDINYEYYGPFDDDGDGDSKLKNVELPANSIIGAEAFAGASNLESIDLTGVKEIGSYAFENCTSLKEIHIPESVTYIGAAAFKGWTADQTIYLPFPSTEDPYDHGYDSNWNLEGYYDDPIEAKIVYSDQV